MVAPPRSDSSLPSQIVSLKLTRFYLFLSQVSICSRYTPPLNHTDLTVSQPALVGPYETTGRDLPFRGKENIETFLLVPAMVAREDTGVLTPTRLAGGVEWAAYLVGARCAGRWAAHPAVGVGRGPPSGAAALDAAH